MAAIPLYEYDTNTVGPLGVRIRFDTDATSGIPAAVADARGNPIDQTSDSLELRTDSQTGAIPRVFGNAATVYVRQLAGSSGGATVPGLVATISGSTASNLVPGYGYDPIARAAVTAEMTRATAAEALRAPLASPALTGTPTAPTQAAGNNSTRVATTAFVEGELGNYVARKYHNTPNPLAYLPQYSSGRIVCGVDAAHTKVWSYNSSGLYQVDALTSTAWSAVTLPTNVSQSGSASPKIVTYGTLMYLIAWNTVTSVVECYSATEGAKTVAPTWSAKLFSFATNGTVIPTAIRVLSNGVLLAGEYTGTPDVSGGPSIHRWDGTTHTAYQIPGARHIHGIYEDPYNPGTVYATIGDFFGSYTPPAALYKSIDYGATWAAISALGQPWQAVALGFDADRLWACSDQTLGGGPYLLDRATLTPKWACGMRQDRIAVPGGAGARYVTDAALTSGSATLTSTAAAFTAADVGRGVGGHNGVPFGTYILTYTNATTVTMSQQATTTGTSQSVVIAGDSFYCNAYAGALDPATGYLYFAANDASNAGNVAGIFVVRQAGTDPELLWTIFNGSATGNNEMFIGGGYLWWGRYGPMPLLTAAA